MLFTSRVTHGTAPPRRYALFLHGILGTGSNLRALAKGFIEVRAAEGWGALLVDLRCHGRSQDEAPPHTLEACVQDLLALEADAPIEAVIGHSFGGKVAMLFAAARPLSYLAVLDSTPSARPEGQGSESVLQVSRALESLPPTFARRDDFAALLQGHPGMTPAIIAWLAMNVEACDQGYRFRLHMPNIRALLASYFHRDAWQEVEALASSQAQIDFVVAGKGSVLSQDDQVRIRALAHVRTVTLPTAGHWVHVDDPQGLLKTVTAHHLP